MMYHKAMAFHDQNIATMIMQEKNPRKQRELGRKVRGFDAKTWSKQREKAVEEGSWYKFTAGRGKEELKKMLLETGDRLLAEVLMLHRSWKWSHGLS